MASEHQRSDLRLVRNPNMQWADLTHDQASVLHGAGLQAAIVNTPHGTPVYYGNLPVPASLQKLMDALRVHSQPNHRILTGDTLRFDQSELLHSQFADSLPSRLEMPSEGQTKRTLLMASTLLDEARNCAYSEGVNSKVTLAMLEALQSQFTEITQKNTDKTEGRAR